MSGPGNLHPSGPGAQGLICQCRRLSRSVRETMAGFGPHEHIRRRAEFQQVYERGTRVHGRLATVFILANTLSIGRLGIAATKRLGGAVERNRAKRLIREVFRRHKIAPGFDVVVVPRRELLDASLTALEIEYRSNIERSLRQLRRSG